MLAFIKYHKGKTTNRGRRNSICMHNVRRADRHGASLINAIIQRHSYHVRAVLSVLLKPISMQLAADRRSLTVQGGVVPLVSIHEKALSDPKATQRSPVAWEAVLEYSITSTSLAKAALVLESARPTKF